MEKIVGHIQHSRLHGRSFRVSFLVKGKHCIFSYLPYSHLHRGLLFQAYISFANVEAAKKAIRDFEAQASQRLREWRIEHAKFKDSATNKLKTHLEDAQRNAWKAAEDVIHQVATEHFDDHDPDTATVSSQPACLSESQVIVGNGQ
jgi:hypothetical protein